MLRVSGMVDELYGALYRWLGPVRGGLAIATVLVCTVLAAMMGVAGGAVIVMGLVSLPFMLRSKYNKNLALGAILAGGSLGVLIPPSIVFIIYGVFAGESIGKLFIGGVGPGLLLSALYVTYIGIRSYLDPELAPALPKEERTMSLRQQIGLLRTLILPILLIMGVLGTIYLGLATPGEAAGIGAFGAIICTAVHRQLNWQNLKEAVYGTIKTLGITFWLCVGAYLFAGVFTLAGGAEYIGDMLSGLPLGRWGILIVMQLILILLGMVIDTVGLVILLVPIFVPVINALGFDSLWFGVVFNVNLQIAYLSPPFGYSLFYLKGVAPPGITVTDIYRSAFPFIMLQLIGLALVMAFPQIILWLPNMMIR